MKTGLKNWLTIPFQSSYKITKSNRILRLKGVMTPQTSSATKRSDSPPLWEMQVAPNPCPSAEVNWSLSRIGKWSWLPLAKMIFKQLNLFRRISMACSVIWIVPRLCASQIKFSRSNSNSYMLSNNAVNKSWVRATVSGYRLRWTTLTGVTAVWLKVRMLEKVSKQVSALDNQLKIEI